MSFLVDLFGYLSVIIHGFTIVAQSMALGGVLFLIFLARPFASQLGRAGDEILRGCLRITAWSALGLVVCEAITVGLQAAVLVGTVDLSLGNVMSAGFAVAGEIKIAAGLLILGLVTSSGGRAAPAPVLLALVLVEIAAATFTTHGNARVDDRGLMLFVEGLHQLGAAIWIGGIPTFVMALNRLHDGLAWRRVSQRFSRMSMIGVASILVSGVVMAYYYIGDLAGFYGTAFGVMVGAKIFMFLELLALGGMNFMLTERLRANPNTPVNRLKRFAEVEIGIGFSIFFAAAALTSSPPAIDLTQDRVTWAEIVERNTPQAPVLHSPSHDDLGIPALQAKLDAEAAAKAKEPPPAFVPGSGFLPPRNLDDIRWSEYNHNWAGIFVGLCGILALMHRAGVRWARHWPLVFIGLGLFLFFRSDPEVWPLGNVGFWDSFLDPEDLQHHVLLIVLVVLAVFEWRCQNGSLAKTRAVYVFPLLTAVAGAALLTHSHAISNVKDQLLIELTHTPLALAGIAAGWARWLELRLDPPGNRIAGWVWPICFIICALTLLFYREI